MNFFDDAFTKTSEGINLELNNLDVNCITSKTNKFNLDNEGNLVVKTISTTGQNMFNIDNIYPVGSIYMSVNNINPNNLFGGTWEAIENRFLIGAGTGYAANSVGGEASVTLNISQLPSHNHSFGDNTTINGEHNHYGRYKGFSGSPMLPGGWDLLRTVSGDSFDGEKQITINSGAHAHYFGGNTSLVGNNYAHNNIPPYLAVYMWKRIS